MVSERETLSSVRNAARLLRQFTPHHRELGVSELSRRLGLSKSTVHRLMATSAAEGFLDQDPGSGKYYLGLVAYDLGAAVAVHMDLHEAVLAPMERLRHATGQTVHVAVLDGREVVYVERLDSPHTVRLFLDIGRRNCAHSTATGKALLASLSEAQLTRLLTGWKLEQKTPYTITDAELLRKELKETKRRGYAQNLNESEMGVLSVAAPIRDRSAKVRAAMSVAGPAVHLDPIMDRLVQCVVESAAIASRRLGYQGSVTSR